MSEMMMMTMPSITPTAVSSPDLTSSHRSAPPPRPPPSLPPPPHSQPPIPRIPPFLPQQQQQPPLPKTMPPLPTSPPTPTVSDLGLETPSRRAATAPIPDILTQEEEERLGDVRHRSHSVAFHLASASPGEENENGGTPKRNSRESRRGSTGSRHTSPSPGGPKPTWRAGAGRNGHTSEDTSNNSFSRDDQGVDDSGSSNVNNLNIANGGREHVVARKAAPPPRPKPMPVGTLDSGYGSHGGEPPSLVHRSGLVE
eukprot:g23972.t1